MRWNEIGINPDYDYLYDPQQAAHYGFCACCGKELYRPFTETCDRCCMDTDIIEEEEE
jgi:hypothetical protein